MYYISFSCLSLKNRNDYYFLNLKSDVDHHIETQTAFWIDSFGGGRAYHGGDYRLNFHHEHNAGQVMNAEGLFKHTYIRFVYPSHSH